MILITITPAVLDGMGRTLLFEKHDLLDYCAFAIKEVDLVKVGCGCDVLSSGVEVRRSKERVELSEKSIKHLIAFLQKALSGEKNIDLQ